MDKPETRKEGKWTVMAWSCACCERCWVFIDGPMRGRCIYAGPFSGYEDRP